MHARNRVAIGSRICCSPEQVFSEINKNYPTMPFSTRVLDARNCRLGMVECLNHGLLHPYPVMHERAGAVIVQLKSTVLLMPNGSDK